MKLFNLLNKVKNKTYQFIDAKGVTLKSIEDINSKLQHVYAMLKDGSYKENPQEFLETIYSVFPIQDEERRRLSIAEQLIKVVKEQTIYSNVSGYMFLSDLHESIYTDVKHNFDKYMYLLDTISNGQIENTELNKQVTWTFKNPSSKHLQCNDEVYILLNKVGPLQLLRVLDLFYNLPVKKG